VSLTIFEKSRSLFDEWQSHLAFAPFRSRLISSVRDDGGFACYLCNKSRAQQPDRPKNQGFLRKLTSHNPRQRNDLNGAKYGGFAQFRRPAVPISASESSGPGQKRAQITHQDQA